jgi:hypothetical protein
MRASAIILLVILHAVDGREVAIAPAQVTSLHAAKEGQPNVLMTDAVHCVVNLTDGKFVSVIETCAEVRDLLEIAR